jgi:hypothetical protein
MTKWANLILQPVSKLVSVMALRADRKQQRLLSKRLKDQSISSRATTGSEQGIDNTPQADRVKQKN